MRCSSCNKNSALCGCSDGPFTTNIQTVCEPNAQCPEPLPCSEYMSAACVFLNNGVYDAGIEQQTSLEEVIQQLVLLITNPDCTTAPAGCQCGGGGGTYTVTNGLYEDPTNNFKLGGELIEDTTIDGVSNGYNMTIVDTKAFNVLSAGEIILESLDEVKLKGVDINFYKSSGSRMMGINELLGQLTLDGYYGGTGILYTNAPAYALGVDNTGNVFKIPYNTGGGIDPITADNGITANTTTNVRLGGPLVQNTTITGNFKLSLGDLGSVDPLSELNLYADQVNLQTPTVAASTAVAGQVPVLLNAATGEIDFRNAVTLTTTGTSGAATYVQATGALNIPNYATATPDPPIFTNLTGLSTTPAWDPSSFSTSTSNFISVTPADTAIITGLVPGTSRSVNGGLVTIHNAATNSVLLIETNPGESDPTAANRFHSPDGSGILLMPGKSLTFFYDARHSYWIDINNYCVSTPFTSFEDFTGLPNAIFGAGSNPLISGRLGMFNVITSNLIPSGSAGVIQNLNVSSTTLGLGALTTHVAPAANIYLLAGRGQAGNAPVSSYYDPSLFAARVSLNAVADVTNDFTATVGLTGNTHITTPSTTLLGGFSYQLTNSATNWFIYAGNNTPVDTGISVTSALVGMYIYTGSNISKMQCITWAPVSTGSSVYKWTINNFTANLPILSNANANAPVISIQKLAGTTPRYLNIDWAGLVKQKRS